MSNIKSLVKRMLSSSAEYVRPTSRSTIFESFTGAWQRNIELKEGNLYDYPVVYICIWRIAQDIAKLPLKLKRLDDNGIWIDHQSPAYSPVLRRPNHYQTTQQFIASWVATLLIYGNAYILKQYNQRGDIEKMHVLDPERVYPLIGPRGDVYYEICDDKLRGIDGQEGHNVVIPAKNIIHHREITPHHPLIGISPINSVKMSAIKNSRLIQSESEFFRNGAAPGGVLTVPGSPDPEAIDDLERRWQANFSGSNAGKVAVISDNMQYTQLKASSADSQVVEQLKYTDEQICYAFGVPPFKVGISAIPAGWKSEDVNIQYHEDALSPRIEGIENLLDAAFNFSQDVGVEFDTDTLWRMNEGTLAATVTSLAKGRIYATNDGRKRFNLPPVVGGDEPMGQDQDKPISWLTNKERLDAEMSRLVGNQPQVTPQEPEPTSNDEEENQQDEETQKMLAEYKIMKMMEIARTEFYR